MLNSNNAEIKIQFSMFDNMLEGISVYKLIFNDKGEVTDSILEYMNSAALKAMGLDLEESIGKSARELFDSDFIKPYFEAINEFFATGKYNRFKVYYPPTDKYFLISGYLPDDKTYITISSDIIEQKKVEEEVIQTRKDWEQTFDAVPDLIVILDNKFRVVRANKAMAEKLGVTPEECIGLRCYEAVHGTDEPPSFCPYRQLLEDGLEHTAEVYEDNLGGDFLVSASPLYDLDGKLIGSVHVARDINKRKQMEEAIKREAFVASQTAKALAESENKFRTLAENSPDIIARFDRQNRHIYVNPATAEPYGRSPEEIIGKTHSELGMDPEKIEFWEGHHEKVFTTGKPETMEFQYKSPQGKEYYFNTRIVPEFVDGEVKSVLAISRDITYIKEAEVKLKEAKDNLEVEVEERTAEIRKQADLLNLTHDAILVRDFNDKITFWNRGAEEVYGWSQDEALGKVAHELLKTEFSEPLDEIKAIVLKYNRWNGELVHIKHDGTKIIVSSRWSLQKDGNNEPIGFMEINIDITERKKAEEHFRKDMERESLLLGLYEKAPQLTDKELYDCALDHAVSLTDSTVGFFHIVSDDQKNIILTTWNSETLKNCTASFETHYPIEQAGNWVDCIPLKRPVIYNDFTNSPNRKGLPEGHIPVKKFMSIPVLDGDKVKFVFGVGNKIEEYDDHDAIQIQSVANELHKIIKQRHWEEALKEAHDNLELKVQERTAELDVLIEELKRSNDELQRFAYVTSHDLQEPLRTIASFTQLLERRYKGKLGSDADEFMDYIVEASIRMKQMIQDLLEYSRVTTKKEKFKTINCEVVLNNVVNSLNLMIEENNAEITHDHLPTLMADESQLTRVFQNLIRNAIKFRKNNIPPEIHISACKDEDKNEYVFSVSDKGIGIEEQYFDRIFTIFQRLHTIEEYQGTGIGLSVSKRIVECHGGRIWVESEPNVGSTFYFTIPVIYP